MGDVMGKDPKPNASPEKEESRPRLLTKSRFKDAHECPSKLFYTGKPEYGNTKNDDPFMKALAKGGFQVGKLAQIHYGPGEEITERDYDRAFAQTRLLLAQSQATVFEAAIRYGNHFIKADIARRNGKVLEIIEVKAKSWNKEDKVLTEEGYLASSTKLVPYLYDIAYQTWVARKAFPEFEVKPFLCLLDKGTTTSVDGLNQKFKIIQDGGSYTVKVQEGLSQKDLGDQILLPFPVQKYVDLIHQHSFLILHFLCFLSRDNVDF